MRAWVACLQRNKESLQSFLDHLAEEKLNLMRKSFQEHSATEYVRGHEHGFADALDFLANQVTMEENEIIAQQVYSNGGIRND